MTPPSVSPPVRHTHPGGRRPGTLRTAPGAVAQVSSNRLANIGRQGRPLAAPAFPVTMISPAHPVDIIQRQRGGLPGPQPEARPAGSSVARSRRPEAMPASQAASIAGASAGSSAHKQRPRPPGRDSGNPQASGPGCRPRDAGNSAATAARSAVSSPMPFRIDGQVSAMNAVTSSRRQAGPGETRPSSTGRPGTAASERRNRRPSPPRSPFRHQVAPVAAQQVLRRPRPDRRGRPGAAPIRRRTPPAAAPSPSVTGARSPAALRTARERPAASGVGPTRPAPRRPASGSRAPSGASARTLNRSIYPSRASSAANPPHTAQAAP